MPRMRRELHRDQAVAEAVDRDARGWAASHASPWVPWHVLVHRLLVRGVLSAPPPPFEPVVWHFPSLDGCVLDFAALPIDQLTWPPTIDKDKNMQTKLAPNYRVPPSHRYHRILPLLRYVGSSYRFWRSSLAMSVWLKLSLIGCWRSLIDVELGEWLQEKAPRGCWRRGPDGQVAVEDAQGHTARDCTQRFSRMRHAHWPDESFADIAGSWRVAHQRLRQGDSVDVASINGGTRSGSHALWEACGVNESGRGGAA